MKLRLSIILICFVLQRVCASQFINLDFDRARIRPGQIPGGISVEDAIPGWVLRFDEEEVDRMLFETVSTVSASAVIWDNSTSPIGSPIKGKFSFGLQSGAVQEHPDEPFKSKR